VKKTFEKIRRQQQQARSSSCEGRKPHPKCR
jgi:hypothetical protein